MATLVGQRPARVGQVGGPVALALVGDPAAAPVGLVVALVGGPVALAGSVVVGSVAAGSAVTGDAAAPPSLRHEPSAKRFTQLGQ